MDGSEPVLMMYNNFDIPRCVFFSKKSSFHIVQNIKKKFDFNYRHENLEHINLDILTLAALFGDVEVVDRLTKSSLKEKFTKKPTRYTDLQRACSSGTFKCAVRLASSIT